MIIIGIYKISSTIHPERTYIGSTANIKKRWNKHLYDLKHNKHHSIKLQRHFNKYGKNDLMFKLVEKCSEKLLLIKEQHYLNMSINYFNICKIAGNCSGRIPWNKGISMSKEFCEKMKIASTGNKNRLGTNHTNKSKNKIRMKLIGKRKLDKIKCDEIRAKYVPIKYSANMLANEYGVCKDTILTIIHSFN